ncbi:MAG: cold-shock protein [Pseudomonadota bacterium]
MPTGKVKFFNSSKRFGFITPDEGGNDVFVHISDLQAAGIASLSEGQSVSYELKKDDRSGKTSAADIKLI